MTFNNALEFGVISLILLSGVMAIVFVNYIKSIMNKISKVEHIDSLINKVDALIDKVERLFTGYEVMRTEHELHMDALKERVIRLEREVESLKNVG